MGRRSREKATRRRADAAPAPRPGQTPGRVPRPDAPPLPIAPETTAITPWAEIWRADGTAFVTIFTLALVFRAAVLVQTARTPFLEVANIDSGSYQKWARQLGANGGWPTENFHP